jgi:magnesium-transporting ATPase (P-type)
MWGRAVFDNIRKFLQFQLTVNIVALTLTFISALTGKDPPLNAVMMLWVNLIMDTMGALALATEPPSPQLLFRRPYKRDASLISYPMIRNILFQSVFQLLILSYLLIFAPDHFHVTAESIQHQTIVFNTFVFCQLFNEMNARSIGSDLDIFDNLLKNQWFMSIIIFTAIGQYYIVEYGGDFVRTTSLTNEMWLRCISLAALSLPLGGLMRLVPVEENEDNYAKLSPLIQDELQKKKKSK